MRQQALLNDINPHTINFYQWLKKGLQISSPMNYEQWLFYEYRRRFSELVTEGEETARKQQSEARFVFQLNESRD